MQQQQLWEASVQRQQQQQQQQQGQRISGEAPYKNPYQPMLLPLLPDMQGIPPELRSFRDQCASGVRQAVAMVTSMEHQLAWERSRRQQAEEDCKVLLAAVELERTAGGRQVSELEASLQDVSARLTGGKLSIAAEELSHANRAATAIQKVYRGNAARKEYEEYLRDILRGVDPLLDPSLLPSVAQSHISNANVRRPGGAVIGPGTGAGGPGGGGKAGGPPLEAVRYDVAMIKKRMQAQGKQDAGQGDQGESTDLHAILKDGYPASSARVVAALTRRCRELQSALVEATEQLEQAQLTIEGLREGNKKVLELSQVRLELNEERDSRTRLQHTIAKLRAIVVAQAAADKQAAQDGSSRYNPYIAAWYRKAHADQEFDQYPPKGLGSRNGVWLLDGPDAEVEFWDDMRAGQPDPILIPKEETKQYQDLVAMQADMEASARRGYVDPLYASPVNDTTFFHYGRDTPIMPVLSAQGMLQESLPAATFMDLHEQLPPHLRAGHFVSGGGGGGPQHADGSFSFPSPGRPDPVPVQAAQRLEYMQGTPLHPMYSALPLIREDQYMAQTPDSHSAFRPPPGGQYIEPLPAAQAANQQQQQQRPATPPLQQQHGVYSPSQQPQQPGGYGSPRPTQQPGGYGSPRPTQQPQMGQAGQSVAFTPMFTPPETPKNFSYHNNTPMMVPPGYQQEFRTVQPYIRDASGSILGAPPLPPGPPPPLPYNQAPPSPRFQQPPASAAPGGLPPPTPGRQGPPHYGYTPGFTPPGTPPEFDYVQNTSQVPLMMAGQQQPMVVRSNIALIQDAPGQFTPGGSRRVTFSPV